MTPEKFPAVPANGESVPLAIGPTRVLALIGLLRSSSKASISQNEISLMLGVGLRNLGSDRGIRQRGGHVTVLETGGVVGPPRVYVRVAEGNRTAFFTPRPADSQWFLEVLEANDFDIELARLPKLIRGPASLISDLIVWPYAWAHGWL